MQLLRTSLLAAVGVMAWSAAAPAQDMARLPGSQEGAASAQMQAPDATAAIHALLHDGRLPSVSDLSENAYDFNAPGIPGFGPMDDEAARERRLAHRIEE